MTSSPNEKSIIAYADLMEEVKLRLEAIDTIMLGKMQPIRSKIAEETCALQLRMICELIALACLVIHGNISGASSTRLRSSAYADFIMNSLKKLHTEFYPIALVPGDVPGSPYTEALTLKSGFLSKDDLVSLYRACGGLLHRGAVKNVLKAIREPNFAFVQKHRNQILHLLNRHKIVLKNSDCECWFGMRENSSGRVYWNIMRRLGPSSSERQNIE